jgi:hypothetical protein
MRKRTCQLTQNPRLCVGGVGDPDRSVAGVWAGLAITVRPESGRTSATGVCKPVATSKFRVRPGRPESGRTVADGGTPDRAGPSESGRPAVPIGPESDGRSVKYGPPG